MPVAMPLIGATASANSTTSSSFMMRSPSASMPTLHLINIASASLIEFRQQRGEFFEAAQVVTGQQDVDVWFRRHHADGLRLVVGVVALVWVHPHDVVAQPGQSLHGIGKKLGISPVETIGADHDHATAAQPSAPPLAHEPVDRLADPSTAFPVDHKLRGALKRLIRLAGLERLRHMGEPSAEAEYLDFLRGALSGIGELK